MKRYVSAALAIVLVAGGLIAARPTVGQTKAEFDRQRAKLVEDVLKRNGIKSPAVLKAMGTTQRHEFVMDPKLRDKAYLDMALPIGDKQTISSPFTVAFMTQSIDPQPTDIVLEIGTGSGYQAAVLAPLVKEVYTIEIVKPLGERAAKTLKRLNYKNVFPMIGDGYKGWPEHAPFDKIIVTCSPEKVPEPLVEQLKEGGLMVIPVGERYQQTIYLMRKKEGKMVSEALMPILFVPMTGAAEEARLVKPDPANPTVINGNFEEPPPKDGFVPGWYYQQQATLEQDGGSPEGKSYMVFRNTEPGRNSSMLQGFPIDGRLVKELDVTFRIKVDKVEVPDDALGPPALVVAFVDENRKDVTVSIVGATRGTHGWQIKGDKIKIPPAVREGLFRIGLFGSTGEASFDDIRLKVTKR